MRISRAQRREAIREFCAQTAFNVSMDGRLLIRMNLATARALETIRVGKPGITLRLGWEHLPEASSNDGFNDE